MQPRQLFWEAAEAVGLWQQCGEKRRQRMAEHLDPGAASSAQGQGWAAPTPVLVFTLPAPAALSPLSQEPQIFGFAPAFGS